MDTDIEKWDSRFLGLAAHISSWSRDPSTRVGAVIVRPNKTIASLGYNGFPRGVDDDPARYKDRTTKYKLVVHGEANAIVAAEESLHGFTIYTWPFPPCVDCAGLIIQAGITRVVAPRPTAEEFERWGDSMTTAGMMFNEAGVENVMLDILR